MNDEIKEILDNLKFNVYETKNWITPLSLNQKTWKILLDYITNLQNENETLKEIINDDMTVYLKGLEDGKEKMKQCFESIYKSRVEKAVEYVNTNLTLVSILDGKKFYGLNDYKFSYQDLLNILQGNLNDE